MNRKYQIVADGFSAYNITDYQPATLQLPDDLEQKAEEFKQRVLEAAKKNPNILFFDGDLTGAYLDSIKPNGESLDIKLTKIKYSQHAGVLRGTKDAQVQAQYVCGLVVTSDNYIVFGKTQHTENQFLGKLAIPAGGLEPSFADATPSFGLQLYKELAEEIGFAGNNHLASGQEVITGWLSGMSAREENYHLTASFFIPHLMSSKDLNRYFQEWKASQEKIGIVSEFKELLFVPNDTVSLTKLMDAQTYQPSLSGRSCDIIDEWINTYQCDPLRLLESKKVGVQVYPKSTHS